MSDPTDSITGLILAGGRGERMGHVDKGLLALHGRPLVAHVADALRGQVARLLISANRNLADYAAAGADVVTDPWADARGPLAGMLAGLEAVATPWLLVVPCDAPRLPRDLAGRLHAAAAARGARAAYAAHGADRYYTCVLVHRDLAGGLRTSIDGGTRAVQRWLAACEAITVELPEPLDNLNTPQDLAAAAA